MSKLWLVARHEYTRHVFQKSFVLILLSVPLVMALTIGISTLSVRLNENDAPVGYVDRAGLLQRPSSGAVAEPIPAPQRAGSPGSPGPARQVPLIPFPTEEEARRALEAREIQAYYLVTADYFETNQVELVYVEPPGDNACRQFSDFVQINRLRSTPLDTEGTRRASEAVAGLPPDIARRAVAGSNLIVRWPAPWPALGSGREFSQSTFLGNLLPFVVGLGFLMLMFMSSGYLLGLVGEEKENRTMEVLVTSVSPHQLIGGKVLGILGIVLTQVAGWITLISLGAWIGGRWLGLGLFQSLRVDPSLVGAVVAVAVPAYVLMAALMAALGAVVQEAQQVTGLFVLPILIPFWLYLPILEDPNGPLAIGLSSFPLTALPTMAVRLTFSQVPGWQLGLSVALTALGAAGAIWLAGRAFRLGMLRYGQRRPWG